MKRSSRPRRTATLSKSLHQQLDAYALAASAAGVGLISLAQPAEAKIVYTPAHAKLVSPLPVDLNRDGIVDFYLAEVGGSGLNGLSACQYLQTFISSIGCSQSSRGTNAIRTIYSKGSRFGAALRNGQEIKRGEQFGKSRVLLGGVRTDSPSYTTWYGPWLNGGKGVKHRYLGLKFKIEGRVHFGWARMEVTTTYKGFTTILTGYAYETIPGKGIIAGKTKGPDVTTVYPASLGHLAAGASAIPTWRSGR
jgi:hypothetical protein